MNKSKIVKDIYSSNIALVILYGFPFGILTFLVERKHDKVTIIIHIFSGLLFGFLMTLIQRKKLRRMLRISTDMKESKNKKYDLLIKHMEVPTTKSERDALLKYIQVAENNQQRIMKNYYPHKYSKALSYAFIVIIFGLTLTSKHLRILASVYPIILIIGVYGEITTRTKRRKMDILKQKLKT